MRLLSLTVVAACLLVGSSAMGQTGDASQPSSECLDRSAGHRSESTLRSDVSGQHTAQGGMPGNAAQTGSATNTTNNAAPSRDAANPDERGTPSGMTGFASKC